VISRSLPQLYCTLPGHRPAGMTLDIQLQDDNAVPWPGTRQGAVEVVSASEVAAMLPSRASISAERVPGSAV
jgi:hypothetical protein